MKKLLTFILAWLFLISVLFVFTDSVLEAVAVSILSGMLIYVFFLIKQDFDDIFMR